MTSLLDIAPASNVVNSDTAPFIVGALVIVISIVVLRVMRKKKK